MSILDRIQRILAAEMQDGRSRRTGEHGSFSMDDLFSLDGDDELRRAIDQAVAEARQKQPDEFDAACALLGIPRKHSPEQLRSAWRAALLKWHPDLFVKATSAEQQEAARKTREINAAYVLLRSQP